MKIIYSSNIITLLYMFRVSSTHLQEDKVVHKQHMVPSLSKRVLVSCWYAAIGSSPYSCISTRHRDSYREWRYHMLLMHDFVLLKMSTWYSKHVEDSNNIWRINNFQCITLVVLYGQFMMHGQRNIKLKYMWVSYEYLFWATYCTVMKLRSLN